MTRPSKSLTPKQHAFCRYVASGQNYTNAYLNAYACNSRSIASQEGSRTASLPHVAAKIQELQAEMDRRVVFQATSDRELVVDTLRQVVNGEKVLDPVQLRAVELLGKTTMVFNPKPDDDLPGKTSSVAQLERIRRMLDGMIAGEHITGVISGECEHIDSDTNDANTDGGEHELATLIEAERTAHDKSETLKAETLPESRFPTSPPVPM